MLKSEKLSEIKTIAIARTDSIGDVVMTLPLCGIIRQHFPNAKLLFIGSSYTKDVIECDSDVDAFIDFTCLKSLPEEEQTAKLRSYNIDCIVFAFPQKQLAKAAKRAGIRIRIATSHRLYNLLYCNHTVNFSRKNSPLNESQLNTFLLDKIIPHKDYSLQELHSYIHFTASESQFRNKELLSPDRFSLILHPKSKGSAREWPMEYYNRLIELLTDKIKNIDIFICGTESEGQNIHLTDSIKNMHNVHNLCGTMTLKEYIEFIFLSDSLVACSTGPLHLAAIQNCHTVGLFPPVSPMDEKRWKPLGCNVSVFSNGNTQCRRCLKGGECLCMREIKPETIAEKIMKIYALSAQQH